MGCFKFPKIYAVDKNLPWFIYNVSSDIINEPAWGVPTATLLFEEKERKQKYIKKTTTKNSPLKTAPTVSENNSKILHTFKQKVCVNIVDILRWQKEHPELLHKEYILFGRCWKHQIFLGKCRLLTWDLSLVCHKHSQNTFNIWLTWFNHLQTF